MTEKSEERKCKYCGEFVYSPIRKGRMKLYVHNECWEIGKADYDYQCAKDEKSEKRGN